ncbi:MAG: tRNA lysidine(34) synthetase TilS [Clostridia bacterium]|nr:tRNA lysidine(34) synthetase TilS [Clostridia bacterium]
MTTELPDTVRQTIQQYNMPLKNRHVIVGFSGGSDSAALLQVLFTLREELRFTLSAAHVNHGIRGEEALRDEAFARAFCEERGIPFYAARYNVPEEAGRAGESCEVCGRRLRYEFFRSVDPDALIATAHNLDDCAETFFLNLARGTGLKGLTGIPPVRDNIIRPLINCSKAEILTFCEENQISYVTDSTNLSDEYSRNKIRHGVLPVLTQINPAFLSVFRRTQTLLRDDEAFLEAQTRRYVQAAAQGDAFSVETLSVAPVELRNRVIQQTLLTLTGTVPEAAHVRSVGDFLKIGGSENLNGGCTVVSDGKRLYLRADGAAPAPAPLLLTGCPARAEFCGREIALSHCAAPEFMEKNSVNTQKINKEVFHYYADCDKIVYPVTVRTKIDGDRFRPAGRGMTKTLKQLFLEHRLTAAQRQQTVILADADGIICAEGFGIDERAAVSAATKEILCITIRRV